MQKNNKLTQQIKKYRSTKAFFIKVLKQSYTKSTRQYQQHSI